jgi:hypothetical protein
MAAMTMVHILAISCKCEPVYKRFRLLILITSDISEYRLQRRNGVFDNSDFQLTGRLIVSNMNGRNDNGTFEGLYTFGGRSF